MPRRDTLVVIYWRDIPAQVNAVAGRDKHQVLLKPRFQKAIDRAAMVAGITTASDYVEEWRRVTGPLTDDPAGIADALAAEIDDAYPPERLEELVGAGGFDPDPSRRDATSPDRRPSP